ncbi:hypothetical protein JR316_0011973 [Psilocybe cubensis]|uniref:Uncharacterized protein n=2 Tax=Psilocybe cubensis TaxID=181762 RepID=A0ACB8GLI0_PSICU|nr:hypothetical protein JR316_0011973 [Psilocybe cubensis]KAH9476398.1 hypothetical protein JR316_0011973 [Psilocybe cubensis]
MAIGCAVTSSVDLWFLMTSIPKVQVVNVPGGTYCVPMEGQFRTFARFWAPPLAFETLLCAMAVYKAYRESESLPEATLRIRGQSLLRIMVRDSVMYFIWCV